MPAVEEVMLITGTSRGIGEFLVRYYLDKGFRVIGCSRSVPGDGLADNATEAYEHLQVDVTSEEEVVAMLRHIRKKYGRLDALINNAGVASMNHALLTPTRTARQIMETNVMGTFNVCREAAKIMTRNKYGRIVNFGTVAVPLKLEGEAVYAASKSAVVTFTQVLARELADYNITCNVVGPSPLQTDLVAGVPAETMQQLQEKMVVKTRAQFQDVAHVIDFFISRESTQITGQVLYLGGVND